MTRVQQPVLEFLSNDAGEEEGLGHAGMETFRDAPYSSLGREHGQNSLDARATDPVKVTIDLIHVPAAEYPDLATLRQTVERCLAQARDEKAKRFFREAKRTLQANTLKVLRIADFNTRGLKGPSVRGMPFHALLKGAGVSEDKAETSGGSFGIGKNAAFAVSDLQTVFYSTLYAGEGGNPEFLAQGKSVLVSHQDADGGQRRASGYWGMSGVGPVAERTAVPEWLRRTEIGTSVFAIGFREKNNWASRVSAALLQNFFGAVHRGQLEFSVDDGRILIDSKTIGGLFDQESIRQGAEQESRLEDLECAGAMYQCLISETAEQRELSIPALGRTTVRILMKDGLPKRVLLLRNGMWITDSLQHFGEKFQRFPMYRDFVAVVECHETQGNALLKQLESPRHDSLSAERLHEDEVRKQAEITMKALARQVRDAIKNCAKPEAGEMSPIEELAEFFSDTNPSDRPPAPGEDANPERLTYKVVPRQKPQRADSAGGASGRSGGGGGRDRARAGGRGGTGDMSGPGKGGQGERGGVRTIPLLEPRNTIGSSANQRILHFTPGTSGVADLRVLATGIEASTALKVLQVDTGELSDDAFRLTLEEGKRVRVTVSLDEPYDGPIDLVASALPAEVAK